MKQHVVLLISLLVVLSPALALGGTFYLGGGFESVSLSGDVDVVDPGGGVTLNLGYKFLPWLALDVLWGASSHTSDFVGNVAYGRFSIGPKFILPTRSPIQPYLTLGISGHSISSDFAEDLNGSGVFLGLGFDAYLNPHHSIGLGWRSHGWTGEDSFYSYEVDSSVVTIVYNYSFTP